MASIVAALANRNTCRLMLESEHEDSGLISRRNDQSGSCRSLLPLTTKSTVAIDFGKREGRRPFTDGESLVSPDVVGLVVPSTSLRVTCFLPQLNQHLSFLVDSGSSVSVLPWSVAVRKLCELRPYCGRVMSVSGGVLDVVGERSVLLKFSSFLWSIIFFFVAISVQVFRLFWVSIS